MNNNPISENLTKVSKFLLYVVGAIVIVWILSFGITYAKKNIKTPKDAHTNFRVKAPQRQMNIISVVRIGPREIKNFTLSTEYGSWISTNPACSAKFITDTGTVKFQYRNGWETRWLLPNENVVLRENTFRAKVKQGTAKLTIVVGRLGSIY